MRWQELTNDIEQDEDEQKATKGLRKSQKGEKTMWSPCCNVSTSGAESILLTQKRQHDVATASYGEDLNRWVENENQLEAQEAMLHSDRSILNQRMFMLQKKRQELEQAREQIYREEQALAIKVVKMKKFQEHHRKLTSAMVKGLSKIVLGTETEDSESTSMDASILTS